MTSGNGLASPKLPALNEFSPKPLGGHEALFFLLDLVGSTSDRALIVEVIRSRWFSEHAPTLADDPDERIAMQRKLAGNVISGMRQAGLLEAGTTSLSLAPLGHELVQVAIDDGRDKAIRAFATHLLRNRSGIELLEAARFVRRRDNTVGKTTLINQLREYGFEIPTGNVNFSRLRDWLAAAGVVDKDWNINEERFEELSGVSVGDIADWSALTNVQRRALVILRLRAESDLTGISSKDLIPLFRLHGLSFDEAQVRRDIYLPLAEQGWITHHGSGSGRGGNGGVITPTERTLVLDVEKVEGLKLGLVPPDLRDKLRTPTAEIFVNLADSDKNVKGLALELLALRIVSEAGLFPVELRKRGIETGGAEVDLLAEGAHLHFSRWLVQCKNVSSAIGVEVLAKELGMATLLRAQVVVILSTGGFTRTVQELAREAAGNTSIQIILLGPDALHSFKDGGVASLREELHRQAVQVLALKQHQRHVATE